MIRFLLLCSFLLRLVGSIGAAEPTSRVSITIEGILPLSGRLHFTINEEGRNEVGRYKRVFVFEGTADKGAVLASNITSYTATATYPNGGIWRTSKTPSAGFIFIYLEIGRASCRERV